MISFQNEPENVYSPLLYLTAPVWEREDVKLFSSLCSSLKCNDIFHLHRSHSHSQDIALNIHLLLHMEGKFQTVIMCVSLTVQLEICWEHVCIAFSTISLIPCGTGYSESPLSVLEFLLSTVSASSSSRYGIKPSGHFGHSSSWWTPRVGHFPLQVSLCSARWEKCAAGAHIKPYVSPQCQSVSGVPTVSFGSASSVPPQPYKLKPHLPVFLPNLSGIKSFQQLCSWAVTVLMASKRIIIASIQQKLFQRDQHFSCFTDSHICLFPCTCSFSAHSFAAEIFAVVIETNMGRPWSLSHWSLMIRFTLFKSHLTFHSCFWIDSKLNNV